MAGGAASGPAGAVAVFWGAGPGGRPGTGEGLVGTRDGRSAPRELAGASVAAGGATRDPVCPAAGGSSVAASEGDAGAEGPPFQTPMSADATTPAKTTARSARDATTHRRPEDRCGGAPGA